MTDRDYLQVKYFSNYMGRFWGFNSVLRPLLICLCLFSASVLNAEPIELNSHTLAPIKLVNIKNGVCGSGMLFGSKIITNFHVADSICGDSNCPNLKVFSGVSNTEAHFENRIFRGPAAVAYDLAILEIDKFDPKEARNFPVSADLIADLKHAPTSDSIYSLTFPGCGKLQLSQGEKLPTSENLYFRSTLPLRHGSSGGPVFYAKGELAGIVSESESILGGLGSLLLGTSFSSTRAIPASALSNLIKNNLEFSSQVETLNKFYLESVVKQKGIKRIEEGSRFLNKTKDLLLNSLPNQSAALPLLGLIDNYPSAVFSPSKNSIKKLSPAETILALSACFEQFGFRSSFSKKLEASEVDKIINYLEQSFPDDASEIKVLTETMKHSDFPGLSLSMLSYLSGGLLTSALLAATWLFMLGFILRDSNTRLGYRILKIAAWSIILPFCASLILIMLYRTA